MTHDKAVLDLHDVAQGRGRKRLFLFGSGPSLLTQMLLLERLQREDTFSCNTLPGWKELPFRPTYHGVTDVPNAEHLRRLVWPEYPEMLRFNVQWPGHDNIPDYLLVEKAPENIQIHSHGFKGLDGSLPPLPTGRTTPCTLLQLGAWFGYQEFYYLGLDLSRGYVYDPELTMSSTGRPFIGDDNPRIMQAVQRCFRRARQEIEAAGRSIYDCTPGGYLNRTRAYIKRGAPPIDILEYKPLERVLA